MARVQLVLAHIIHKRSRNAPGVGRLSRYQGRKYEPTAKQIRVAFGKMPGETVDPVHVLGTSRTSGSWTPK
jgi:hypothetical protein